jgi:2-polyprenyl-3-methyl-5-hydroxy-6-metoxy-1,4-benzoquinol methylase
MNVPLTIEDYKAVFDLMSRMGHCSALQSRRESKASSRVVQWLGLPSHHDAQKNWDTLKAFYYIVGLGDPETPVLDAGSSGDSAILKWLSLLGYQSLYACDLRPKSKKKYAGKNINFSVQDLTRTNYSEHFFQAVTSISVIEHGVDLSGYIQEMFRILRPGGLLLTSTDYWSELIDCCGIYPYGEKMGEMKVFQRHELEELVNMAEENGFKLCSPLNLDTRERAVRWERVDREYTFAFIALQKMTCE